MNIWERYPSKGTHYEAMQSKVKQHTWEYYVYYGRDRDDWCKCTIKASAADVAYNMAMHKWDGTGYTVKKSSFKVIDNQ